jgi:hypothetical protein
MLGLTLLNKTIKIEVEDYITMKLMPLVAVPNRCTRNVKEGEDKVK